MVRRKGEADEAEVGGKILLNCEVRFLCDVQRTREGERRSVSATSKRNTLDNSRGQARGNSRMGGGETSEVCRRYLRPRSLANDCGWAIKGRKEQGNSGCACADSRPLSSGDSSSIFYRKVETTSSKTANVTCARLRVCLASTMVPNEREREKGETDHVDRNASDQSWAQTRDENSITSTPFSVSRFETRSHSRVRV